MESIELPITIVATFIGSSLSIGITWGLLRGQLKALEVAVKSLDEDRTTQRKEFQLLQIEMVRVKADLEALDDLKRNSVSRESMNQWMNGLNATLKELKESLRGKVSMASLARVVPRVDPESDPPPELPPQRGKLPSRQIR